MILLNSPQVVQVVLGGAITTNQLSVTASWNDMTSPATAGSKLALTNGVTAVTIAPTPTGGVTRRVQTITIQNQDTAAATVTVQFYDGTVTGQIIVAVLQSGEQLLYDNGGWCAMDSAGTTKQTQSNSSAQVSIVQSAAASISGVASAQLSTMTVAASQALSAATSDSTIASANLSTLTVAASQAKSAATSVSTVTSTVLSRASSGGS